MDIKELEKRATDKGLSFEERKKAITDYEQLAKERGSTSWEEICRAFKELLQNDFKEIRKQGEQKQTTSKVSESRKTIDYPLDLTRKNRVFWPLSKRQIKNKYEFYTLTQSGPWGELTITGHLLGTWEQTVMLGLLALRTYHTNEVDCTLAELARAIGKQPGTTIYQAMMQAIKNMHHWAFSLKTKHGQLGSHLINHYHRDEKTKRLRVELGKAIVLIETPGFLPVTLDRKFYLTISSQYSKHLYLFLESQRPKKGEKPIPYHYSFLAESICMDGAFNDRKTRKIITESLNELRKKRYVNYSINNKGKIYIEYL